MKVRIRTRGPRLLVEVPYSEEFIKGAKELAAWWNPGSKTWSFDVRREDEARQLCRDIFGTDDTKSEPKVVVIVPPKGVRRMCDEQWASFLGVNYAYRHTKTSAVQMKNGAGVLEGTFPDSAGSRANPAILEWNDEAPSLRILDVPRVVATKMVAELGATVENHTHSVTGD